MKKLFLILVVLMITVRLIASGTGVRAYISHAAFTIPGESPYMETYLSVLAKSLKFVKNQNDKFQSSVQVTLLIKQNNVIKDFRKFNLLSAEIEDTTNINFVMFDQQRIAVTNGSYNIEVNLVDNNRSNSAYSSTDSIHIDFQPNKLQLSDIELVESITQSATNGPLTKSGYDLMPYQDYFYPKSVNKLSYYTEIYNLSDAVGENNQALLTAEIHSFETGKPIEPFVVRKRLDASKVNLAFNEMDISNLPTGKYNLVISIRDRENKELANKSIFISRSNPGVKFNLNNLEQLAVQGSFVSHIQVPDSINEFIKMCTPIATMSERQFIDNLAMNSVSPVNQKFFYYFWIQRNEANPEKAWLDYYGNVQAVNQQFGTKRKKGYETDRGRVYLQYGPPNLRNKYTVNPDSYPHEIWQYYTLNDQTNVRFVFYTRELSTNDFSLLHSTMKGEVKDIEWQYVLKVSKKNMRPRERDYTLYSKPLDDGVFGERTGDEFLSPY
jgi:GWxTD domain-containing protein